MSDAQLGIHAQTASGVLIRDGSPIANALRASATASRNTSIGGVIITAGDIRAVDGYILVTNSLARALAEHLRDKL